MFTKQLDGSYAESEAIGSISGKVVDDTRDFEVPVYVVPPVCESYLTESECVAAGCYWWGSELLLPTCHKMPKDVVCSDYITESTCDAAGCYWYDDECHSKPKEGEIPWLIILGAIGGAITIAGVILAIRR